MQVEEQMEAYQLLLTGQVRTFGVEVPQGSGAQLLLGLCVQLLGRSDAGEQQQSAEQRPAAQPGAPHGPGARRHVDHPVDLPRLK